MATNDYDGLLIIGDPHLEGRQPGFRCDDYPRVILDKLAWSLDYATAHRLLPAILGDLFDKPRDNPNWLLGELITLFDREMIGLYGNHDCADPELSDNDSLSLLVKSGRLRLVSEAAPWHGLVGGRAVVVGGSSYRQPIPTRFDPRPWSSEIGPPLVAWLTHHDVLIPGYDDGRVRPREIDGIDLVVNGHIHRRLVHVPVGKTLWLNPGNISRRCRSEASRQHLPSVLRIDVSPAGYQLRYVEVPHRPFEEVFHAAVLDATVDNHPSAFVAGLSDLQARRTASGAGLMEFLDQNLGQFEQAVADEIRTLAMEVTSHVAN